MAEQKTPGPTDPKHLDDFKGTKREQNAAKSKFISDFGYAAYEKLVQNSSLGVKR
jgi:hypothetical protein